MKIQEHCWHAQVWHAQKNSFESFQTHSWTFLLFCFIFKKTFDDFGFSSSLLDFEKYNFQSKLFESVCGTCYRFCSLSVGRIRVLWHPRDRKLFHANLKFCLMKKSINIVVIARTGTIIRTFHFLDYVFIILILFLRFSPHLKFN